MPGLAPHQQHEPAQGSRIFQPHVDATIEIGRQVYRIHQGVLFTIKEAERVFELMEAAGKYSPGLSRRRARKQAWSDDEVHLLQWTVLEYSQQQAKAVHEFVLRSSLSLWNRRWQTGVS